MENEHEIVIEVEKVPGLIVQWLQIGYPDKPPTTADVLHSALLQRLLSGKKPLAEAPPRAYSYPWYDLIDDGRYEGACEVGIYEDGTSILGDEPIVVLNQAVWRLINDLGHNEYEIEWPATGLRATLTVYENVSGSHYRCVVLLDD